MAATPTPGAARPARERNSSEFRNYEEYFTATPDPWAELAKLEPGADRSAASTVRTLVTSADPAQRPALEAKLLQVLAAPHCTVAGRMFVARMLALIGSAKCVPAIAPLLSDPATADAARYALDAIEEPAVDEAYRAALGKLAGLAKAGLIGSIALRGDTAALPAISAISGNAGEAADVRAAASRAVEWLQRLSASRAVASQPATTRGTQ